MCVRGPWSEITLTNLNNWKTEKSLSSSPFFLAAPKARQIFWILETILNNWKSRSALVPFFGRGKYFGKAAIATKNCGERHF